MLINVIIVVVMLIALFSMMACSKKAKRGGEDQNKAQTKAFILLLVVVAGAVWLIVRLGVFGDSDAGLVASEQGFAQARAIVLAQSVAKDAKGGVLVLVSKGYAQNKVSKMIVDGIKKGLGAGVKVQIQDVSRPSTGKDDPMAGDPGMMKAADFNTAIDKHDECKLIIPIIPLPMDWQNISAMSSGDKKFAILNGTPQEMEKQLISGKIVATACIKPGFVYEEKPCPSDAKAAFADRYVLVTGANVKKIITELKAKRKRRR